MGKLVITKEENHIISALFEEDILTELSVEPIEEKKLLGNIYTGKVQNIVKNINAAFVEVEKGLLCYYSLDTNQEHIFLNGKKKKELQQGDEILVQVCREAMKTKAPSVTSNINLTGKAVFLHKSLYLHKKSLVTEGNCLIGFPCTHYQLLLGKDRLYFLADQIYINICSDFLSGHIFLNHHLFTMGKEKLYRFLILSLGNV